MQTTAEFAFFGGTFVGGYVHSSATQRAHTDSTLNRKISIKYITLENILRLR